MEIVTDSNILRAILPLASVLVIQSVLIPNLFPAFAKDKSCSPKHHYLHFEIKH